jgi:hypothetical protein
MHDLQPYVCTYRGCPSPGQLYGSRYAWLEHERLAHRRVWQCLEHTIECVKTKDEFGMPTIQYENSGPIFNSKDLFEKHLVEHGKLDSEQAQHLADFAESSSADDRQTCPFCLRHGPFVDGLAIHMAFHQEKMATFALPRNMEACDNDQSQSSGAQGIRSGGSLESISPHSETSESKLSERVWRFERPPTLPKLLSKREKYLAYLPLEVAKRRSKWTPILLLILFTNRIYMRPSRESRQSRRVRCPRFMS